jgi:hypothetical protein
MYPDEKLVSKVMLENLLFFQVKVGKFIFMCVREREKHVLMHLLVMSEMFHSV